MSDVVITPHMLGGTVAPPPSKSAAHRAVICAALARGESRVTPYVSSQDIDATMAAMRALGAEISITEDGKALCVCGDRIFSVKKAEVPCGESGSTLRFLIPLAAVGGVEAVFTGQGRLPERPLGPYFKLLPAHGCRCERPQGGSLPLHIAGRLTAGRYELPGDISSQFITGLLLALPFCDTDSNILLTTPVESAGYINMTLDIMREFGITIKSTSPQEYHIPGGQGYKSHACGVERDWSQAAFWLASGALGGNVRCSDMRTNSLQGDMAILSLLRRFGAEVHESAGVVSVTAQQLHGIELDASQVPDLVPILSVIASLSQGVTRITGAARLRIKESDRLHAMAEGLNALGGQVQELPDGLVIRGVPQLHGGTVDGFHDHRIVMALAIAAQRCTEKVTIRGCESVNKSYPRFFEDYRLTGGYADVVQLG